MQFLGGAGEVGRSAILVSGGTRILLDYGIKLNEKIEYPGDAGRIDACVLSHAHLDHSGFTPRLYKDDIPPTYGTAPTKEFSQLLINDSLKISRKRHGTHRFSKRHLRLFAERFGPRDFNEAIEVGDFTVTLHDAGHISGSAVTRIETKSGKKIVYTGDFKLEHQELQGGAEIVKSDVLITESTYAAKEHPDRKQLIREFIAEVEETIDNGGTALVPVFAVGRAQEVVKVLYDHNLAGNTFIDGMAKKATEITLRHPSFCKNAAGLASAMRKITQLGEEASRETVGAGGEIIVTTAGMLNGGPVLNYITRLNQRSKIFFTGFQVEGTNGRKVLDGKPIKLGGRKEVIKAPVAYFDFSAHAGRNDLFEYARKSGPETVFCVHGERDVSLQFAEELKLEGFEAHAPKLGETVKVDL